LATLDDLFQAAALAQTRAYAPYSQYHVGAAIISSSGQIFSGCNVENASYPTGICAEANAIGAMINAGETQIADILVVGDATNTITPCGLCRQRIFEFSSPRTKIHCADATGVKASYLVGDLLPHAFGPSHLKAARDGESP
jgi:cytidine deaminase